MLCSVMLLHSDVLREYYFSLGDEGALEERQRQLQRLSQLLAGLGVDIAAEAAERGMGEAAAPGDQAAADADAGEQVRLFARQPSVWIALMWSM